MHHDKYHLVGHKKTGLVAGLGVSFNVLASFANPVIWI
jgi:hypothetical protein